MSDFKIQSDVPLPEKPPFAAMKIGDSFEFDSDLNAEIKKAAEAHGKAHGWRFIARKVGEGKSRCWRSA